VGGSLVGDADEFARLLHLTKTGEALGDEPESLILGARGEGALGDLPDAVQACSCNNVTNGDLCAAIASGDGDTLVKLKACTKAGAGGGGCVPLVTDIFNQHLKLLGREVRPVLGEHVAFIRQELYRIVYVRKLISFEAVL